MAQVRAVEGPIFSGGTALTEAVARGLHRLMAIKDEYEVARLYTAPAFRESLAAQFEGKTRLHFHLAPPLLAKRDQRTGELQKRSFGPWMMTAFRLLAPLRVLRGTPLDPFGRTEERRAERRLLAEYDSMLDEILQNLAPGTLSASVSLAALPDQVRGFGHVKEKSMRRFETMRAELLEQPAFQLVSNTIAQLNAAHVFAKPIVTEVTPLKGFYDAESYHQDYALNHPDNPYIMVCDRPKIDALKKEYPELFVDYHGK